MAMRRAGLFEAPSAVASVVRGDSGAADTTAVWRALGETAGQIMKRLQPALDRYAESQARADFEAGRRELRFVWNEEDQAYNNAMVQAYLARATVDVSSRAMELEAEHGLDVAAFDEAWEAARTGFMEHAPPDLAMHMETLLDREYAEARQRIGQRRRNAAIQQFGQDAEALLSHMEQTLSGYTDLTSPDYQNRVAEYRAQLEAFANNPLSGISREEAALRYENTLSRHQARAFQESALAVYEDGGRNAEAADRAIEFARAAIYSPNLTMTDAQREAAFVDVRQVIMAEERERLRALREARAELRAYRMELREEARDTIAGFRARARAFSVIPDDEIQRLTALAEASGSAELQRQAREIAIENTVRQRLQGLPLARIERELDALQERVTAGGDDADDAAVALNAGRAYSEHLRNGDALDAAQAHFGQTPPPIFTDEGGASLGARIRFAERAATDLGAAKPTYFQPGERETLAGIARGGGNEALALAREVVGAAYDEEGDSFTRAQRMLEEVAGQGGEALAAAGTTLLIGGEQSAPAARYMMEAQRLRQLEGYQRPDIPGVDDGRVRQNYVDSVLGSLGTQLRPEARAQLQYGADLIFEGLIAEDRSRLREWRTLYPRAVRMALGEVQHDGRAWGGVVSDRGANRVVIPNWMRADQFRTIRQSLTLDDYAAANGVTENEAPNLSLRDLRNARLQWTGEPGKYWLLDDDGARIVTAPGTPYMLDFNRIRSRLSRRRADAVR